MVNSNNVLNSFTMLQTQNEFVIHIEKSVFSTSNLCKEKLAFWRA
jgi:hypothetical protein